MQHLRTHSEFKIKDCRFTDHKNKELNKTKKEQDPFKILMVKYFINTGISIKSTEDRFLRRWKLQSVNMPWEMN